MSKTFENQALKAKTLAMGMQQHLKELSTKGVEKGTLDLLIKTCEDAIEKSKEVDRIRKQATEKLGEAKIVLNDVKERYNELRIIIRNNYPPEQWSKFGLMDKR